MPSNLRETKKSRATRTLTNSQDKEGSSFIPLGYKRRILSLQLCALPVLIVALSACSDNGESDSSNGGSEGSVGGGGVSINSADSLSQSSGGTTQRLTNSLGGAPGSTISTEAITLGGTSGATMGGSTVALGGSSSTIGGSNGTDPDSYVSDVAGTDRFPLVADNKTPPIVVNKTDFPGVLRTAKDLKADVKRVSNLEPTYAYDVIPDGATEVVLVGTLGKSPLIDSLVANKKIDVSDIAGLWETFLIEVVQNPLPGINRALVITGSDQRGTIFGVYDVSKQIGVSPWYYWDDVPPRKSNAIWVLPGHHTLGQPAVKYRGFFINDENPQLGTWAYNTFGPSPNKSYPQAFHSPMYEKVFELMLRIKANYLWPAVWGRAFAEDDPKNHEMAKAYGIIMGTSHEAPMMRGIEEWNRHVVPEVTDSSGTVTTVGSDPYGGNGLWRYSKNPAALKQYWTEGIKRMVTQDFEGVVTLGMRGPGDVSLPVGDGIDLMKTVITDQRAILERETGKSATATPQVWTLYKEVQDYWDQGLRAPDDVTVVWCDDNWGNIRELPKRSDLTRTGGYGLYYHFDYVGGGRNYKWVDTNSLPNLWEQLNLSYNYGVSRLWMVNVGDLKNEEHPLEFFMDYAWNPSRWTLDRLQQWEEQWSAQQFGKDRATAIANVLHRYGKLQSRRKPELTNRAITLDPTKDVSTTDTTIIYDDAASPFSLINYRELENVVAEWNALASDASAIRDTLPAEMQDAYFQLVYYQVQATAFLYAHRLAVFRNKLYKAQGRASTNDWGVSAQANFDEGTKLATYYNTTLANGKWNGWQTQPYVGYGDVARYGSNASWQQPEKDNVALADAPYPQPIKDFVVPDGQLLGVSIEGSDKVWSVETATIATLPTMSRYQTQPPQYIEVFRRGKQAIHFKITVPTDYQGWLTVEPNEGELNDTTKEVRTEVHVDWNKAPSGTTKATLIVTSDATSVPINAVIDNTSISSDFVGFVEASGYVAMEAEHYDRKVDANGVGFQFLPDIGRTASGLSPFPVTAASQTPGGTSPHLEYDVYLTSTGNVTLWAYLSPRNNVLHNDGLKYAVSLDNSTPQIVNITKALNGIPMNKSWERNTSDNVNLTSTKHSVTTVGKHTLKFWMVDPTIIVQKLVLDMGGVRPSYLGPPESHRITH
jgi:Glycosyl hydrolase family 115/Gylcosyl hydrolase family 115 C-terminal domain